MNTNPDVLIVGGGLGGLATATALARQGRSVTVLERSRHLGGRAVTRRHQGFQFNLGPHALYRNGAAWRVLEHLGIRWTGKSPQVRGTALAAGRAYPLPTSPGGLLFGRLLNWREKWRVMRFLSWLPKANLIELDRVPLGPWLEQEFGDTRAGQLVAALCRLTSYGHRPELASAGAGLHQLRLGIQQGVQYLDDGWQSLVDGLATAAREAGVRVETSCAVRDIRPLADGWQISTGAESEPAGAASDAGRSHPLPNSLSWKASSLVLAVDPRTARRLLGALAPPALARQLASCLPVEAACWDLAVRRLPRPENTFALGIDQPWYFSVHSAAAKLAPAPGALIHVAKYLGADSGSDPRQVRGELASLLDRLQPGWQAELVEEQWLPRMTVSPALVTAAQGGLPGRPRVVVEELTGLYLVGDWVGDEGMLLDASLASAERASQHLLARPRQRARPLPVTR